MEERSIFLDMVVDLACTVELNWIANIFEPNSYEARSRAGVLIIAI